MLGIRCSGAPELWYIIVSISGVASSSCICVLINLKPCVCLEPHKKFICHGSIIT